MDQDKKALENLIQLRDEIKLKSHLLKADLKDEWERLEKEWEKNQETISRLKSVTKDTARDLKSARDAGLDSLKEGYARIKSTLENRM